MLWEAWQYLKTQPTQKYAKEMGYLKESIAMAARAKRCAAEWQIHYEYCKTAIMQAAQKVSKRRKVVIFGAGSLNDIPLKELSSVFIEVVLVDLVFLENARKQAQEIKNVTLVEMDVTDSLPVIYSGESTATTPSQWLDDRQVDLVVSLNLVTQLPLIPVRWLMDKYNLENQAANILGKQLIFSHLMYLKQFDALICLIADREGVEFNRQGKEIDRYDPWWDIEPPSADYTWQWEVVPLGEGEKGICRKNTVGVSFIHPAS